VRRLADDFQQEGGDLIKAARVSAVMATGSACRGVRLADGTEIESRIVVIAGGPWSNDLLEPLGLAIPFQLTSFRGSGNSPRPV
jgi:glycine/D-amino acid oxidase-like deaminating enzyme